MRLSTSCTRRSASKLMLSMACHSSVSSFFQCIHPVTTANIFPTPLLISHPLCFCLVMYSTHVTTLHTTHIHHAVLSCIYQTACSSPLFAPVALFLYPPMSAEKTCIIPHQAPTVTSCLYYTYSQICFSIQCVAEKWFKLIPRAAGPTNIEGLSLV